MTRKFKNAVNGVVYDGKITPEENEAIFLLAEKEGIEKHEVQIYLSTQLKLRKLKIEENEFKTNNKGSNSNNFLNSELVETSGKMVIQHLPEIISFVKQNFPKILKFLKR